VFKLGESVSRFGEWDTCDNPRGLQTILYLTPRSVTDFSYLFFHSPWVSCVFRSVSDGYWCIFDIVGYSRKEEWPCTAGTSP